MKNFYVKYKGEVVGVVKNNKYTPNETKVKGVFNFLNKEIEDIGSVNFFTNRIDNCKRFSDVSVSYSTDGYLFEPF